MRWLVGSIADWTSLYKQAYKALKPGGYLESYEPSSCIESEDGTVTETSALNQWGKFFVEGGRAIGRPFTIFEEDIQRKAMEEAGFVDIEERVFKVSWAAATSAPDAPDLLKANVDRTPSVDGPRTQSFERLARICSSALNRTLRALCFSWPRH